MGDGMFTVLRCQRKATRGGGVRVLRLGYAHTKGYRLKQVITQNQTSGAVIAPQTSVADGMWSRFRGLMLQKPLEDGEALLIKPCSSVHMFFMRFALDIVFFDKAGAVVKIVPNLKPWRMALGGKGAWSALELPVGVAAGISVGDQIAFEGES